MERKTYTGFYPSRPYWAVSKLDFTVPKADGWFRGQMSEVVYEKHNADVSLIICRDGQILFRIARLEPAGGVDLSTPIEDTVSRWGEYLDYLNSFYLLLDSATIETDRHAIFNLHEITHRDAFRTTFEGEREVSQSIASESIASVFQMGRYLSSYSQDFPIEYDPKLSHRSVVSLAAISLAGESIFKVVSSQGSEKHLASYAKSLSEYKVGNYETAIILSWFITESVANWLWNSQLDALNADFPGGRRRINRERRDFLTGRDFTASITTNLLELFGQIDLELLNKVDEVRGYRNKIVHTDSFQVGANEATKALAVAREMIIKRWAISFTPSFSYSVQGL